MEEEEEEEKGQEEEKKEREEEGERKDWRKRRTGSFHKHIYNLGSTAPPGYTWGQWQLETAGCARPRSLSLLQVPPGKIQQMQQQEWAKSLEIKRGWMEDRTDLPSAAHGLQQELSALRALSSWRMFRET